jgi:hypothetical protein
MENEAREVAEQFNELRRFGPFWKRMKKSSSWTNKRRKSMLPYRS